MKNMILACLILGLTEMSIIAREDPAPNTIIVNILSPRGYSFAFVSLHEGSTLSVKERIGADLDIIPSGKSGTWAAESRAADDQVQIIITVYDDKGKSIASASAKGKKVVGTVQNNKPVVISLDDKKD